MKYRLLTILLVSLSAVLILGAVNNKTPEKNEYDEKRIMMACRAIGDKLLAMAGDYHSRVLPVYHDGNGSFIMEFQTELSINPDSLVKIAQNSLSTTDLSQNYVVSVLNCVFDQVIYGFEISAKNDNIPCLGREIPKGCYTVDIHFKDYNQPKVASLPYTTFMWVTVGFTALFFIAQPFIKNGKLENKTKNDRYRSIGRLKFDIKHRQLLDKKTQISLTDKEYRILQLLSANPNEIVSRDQLLKEIWEDDGVFTGRSLDMFVSKLRKKLKPAPKVKITNVYGKGYRLDIDQ